MNNTSESNNFLQQDFTYNAEHTLPLASLPAIMKPNKQLNIHSQKDEQNSLELIDSSFKK